MREEENPWQAEYRVLLLRLRRYYLQTAPKGLNGEIKSTQTALKDVEIIENGSG